jgi:cysteinyl-tRNA synthetase
MLRLYDTRSRQAEQIDPARRGQLRVFSCGPPATRYAHLGDLRTALLADLIRRAAHRHRLSVLVCEGSNDVGQAADWQLYAAAFRADSSAINIRPPDYAPRASESIGLITDMIASLISAGHAYATADGSVYFGAAGQPDWALWRAGRGAGEASWSAPWGQGSPGSDIACSAMSLHYLGDVIDIHTGGTESRFAHHATERAQSDAAAGHEVVRHWVHGELVRFEDSSTDPAADRPPGSRDVLLADLGQRGLDPLALRLAFLERRYRERLDLTWPGLMEAGRTLRRWREQVADWATHPSRPMSAPHVAAIASAFDDDLDAPAALAVLRDLASAADVPAGAKFETFAHVDQLLGLDLVREVGR